jgi:hypothetical protein
MNTEPNLEEYPRLTPPDVVYEHKASLKKPVVIPLYTKLVAAAAAVALLFGIFWHRSLLPEQELMAELKPVEAVGMDNADVFVLAESQACFILPKKAEKPMTTTKTAPVSYERVEMPMLAELQPKTSLVLIPMENLLVLDEEILYANNEIPTIPQNDDYDEELSFVGRSIYMITEGEHDSFASIFKEGIQSFKTEMASIATTIQSSRSQLRQMVR